VGAEAARLRLRERDGDQGPWAGRKQRASRAARRKTPTGHKLDTRTDSQATNVVRFAQVAVEPPVLHVIAVVVVRSPDGHLACPGNWQDHYGWRHQCWWRHHYGWPHYYGGWRDGWRYGGWRYSGWEY
jgi:hypothetical protein